MGFYFLLNVVDLQCYATFCYTAKWFRIYICFKKFFSIIVYYRILSIVSCAIQEDSVVYPFSIQGFVAANSNSAPLGNQSLFSTSVSLSLFYRYVWNLKYDANEPKWRHTVFVFLFLTYFTWYNSLSVHVAANGTISFFMTEYYSVV